MEYLERVFCGVDEPKPRDTFACVDRTLDLAVDADRPRRERLAHPVGCQGNGRRAGALSHSFAAPPRDVGDYDVLGQVELGLIENHPTAGPTSAATKRRPELLAEGGNGVGVISIRTREDDQLAIQSLTDSVLGQRRQLFAQRSRLGCVSCHGLNVAGGARCATSSLSDATQSCSRRHRDFRTRCPDPLRRRVRRLTCAVRATANVKPARELFRSRSVVLPGAHPPSVLGAAKCGYGVMIYAIARAKMAANGETVEHGATAAA